MLPGTGFGAAGAGFLRLAYTQGEAGLRRGMERIGNYLRTGGAEGRRPTV